VGAGSGEHELAVAIDVEPIGDETGDDGGVVAV